MAYLLSENRDGLMSITLNRPDALNSLNLEMIEGLLALFDEAEKDASVHTVFLKGSGGKAFCAGGDIKAARAGAIAARDGTIPLSKVTDFFVKEYTLNKRIFHFPKRTVSFMNGITMGGGVGLANACNVKIATDKTIWAMPEVTIGFFPDVGAGYYLSRAPGFAGRYLGLTGIHLSNAADLIKCGLATHYASVSQEEILIRELSSHGLSGGSSEMDYPNKSGNDDTGLPYTDIKPCFSANTVEEILTRLESAATEWSQRTAALMRAKSPTSLKVTLRHLQMAEMQSFDDIIDRDLRLAERFLQGHDMLEGIRAAVVDKDRNPQWNPSHLEEVSIEAIFLDPRLRGDDR